MEGCQKCRAACRLFKCFQTHSKHLKSSWRFRQEMLTPGTRVPWGKWRQRSCAEALKPGQLVATVEDAEVGCFWPLKRKRETYLYNAFIFCKCTLLQEDDEISEAEAQAEENGHLGAYKPPKISQADWTWLKGKAKQNQKHSDRLLVLQVEYTGDHISMQAGKSFSSKKRTHMHWPRNVRRRNLRGRRQRSEGNFLGVSNLIFCNEALPFDPISSNLEAETFVEPLWSPRPDWSEVNLCAHFERRGCVWVCCDWRISITVT